MNHWDWLLEPIIISTPKKVIFDSRKEEKKEMTKKYRVKIDTPWSLEGDVYEPASLFSGWVPINSFKGGISFSEHPEKFPDLFEPLQDPVEKVAEWLRQQSYCLDHGFSDPELVAGRLLRAGLDPERLG